MGSDQEEAKINHERFDVARLAEWFNVRTAWHGPGDTSPIGHAANAHIDLAVWNFGIQEENHFAAAELEAFPGHALLEGGYLYGSDRPGLGIDIDEQKAAALLEPGKTGYALSIAEDRRVDGTVVRP